MSNLDALYIRNHAPSDNLHNRGLIFSAGLQQDAIVGSNSPPPASCLCKLKESERVELGLGEIVKVRSTSKCKDSSVCYSIRREKCSAGH